MRFCSVAPLAAKYETNLALQVVYANALVQADNADEAIKVARRALRKDERYTPAMMVLVKANMQQGQLSSRFRFLSKH